MRRVVGLLVMMCMPVVYAAEETDMVLRAVAQLSAKVQDISPDVKRIAILSIEIQDSDRVAEAEVIDYITEQLLKTKGRFIVIERKRLNAVLEEQKLSMSGLVDEKTLTEVGGILGADAFLSGTLKFEGKKVLLTLKLTDVKTAGIVWTEKLIGEKFSWIKLGIGIRYNRIKFQDEVTVLPGGSPSTVATTVAYEAVPSHAGGAYIGYRQGFGASPYFSLGADVICFGGGPAPRAELMYSRALADSTDEPVTVPVLDTVVHPIIPDTVGTMRTVTTTQAQAKDGGFHYFGIAPRLSLHLKPLLKTRNDAAVIYIGGLFGMMLYQYTTVMTTQRRQVIHIDSTGNRTVQEDIRRDSPTEEFTADVMFGAVTAGFDLNPARFMSVYCDALIFPAAQGKSVEKDFWSSKAAVAFTIPRHVTFTAGVTFYLLDL